MSGHSKWSQIKHKKAITDAKKSKIFGKLSRLISVAAREKGPDPQTNITLRAAIEKAKSFNMPNDNIERAIKKGAGEGEALEEITLEAYGPFGSALLIEAITDNRNRTMQELRKIILENGGKPASQGSVAWQFDKIGRIELPPTSDPQKKELIENLAIENDALDIKISDDKITIITAPEKLHQTKGEFEKNNIEISVAELDFEAKNYIQLKAEEKAKIEKLYEAIDEHDDVQEIYSNVIG